MHPHPQLELNHFYIKREEIYHMFSKMIFHNHLWIHRENESPFAKKHKKSRVYIVVFFLTLTGCLERVIINKNIHIAVSFY